MEFHRIQNAIDLLSPAKPAPAKPDEQTVAAPEIVAQSSGEKPAETSTETHAATTLVPAAATAPAQPEPEPAGAPQRETQASSNGDSRPRPLVAVPSLFGLSEPDLPAELPARAGVPSILPLPQQPRASSNGEPGGHQRSSANTATDTLPGEVEPKLSIAWGDFHQGVTSSIGALFRHTFGRGLRDEDGRPITCADLRDTRVDGRVPVRAVIAAGLWHVAILAMPISLFTGLPHTNPALQNVELTWSGPIDDLPLLEIPREQPKPTAPRVEAPKPQPVLPPVAIDAYHPRQRIFTDPVHPTHPRQTLINPAAPKLAPKLLPKLPNLVQFQIAGPAKPRMQITDEMLKLHPRERRTATSATAAVKNAPNLDEHVAQMDLPAEQNGPARPKLELNAGAAPRVTQRKQSNDSGQAPDITPTQLTAATGGAQALVAISAAPAPPAPVVQPPQGNLAARVSLGPEGKKAGEPPAGNAGAGKSSVGISISAPTPTASASGANAAGKMSATSSPRLVITRPDPKAADDAEERTSPPDFAALPPGAKPEVIFGSRKVYTMNVNMPNLNSSTGSWILNFSEFRTGGRPRMASSEVSGPVVLRKVDPKYPPTLIAEHVEGEVVLYAVIRRDGSIDSIQLVRGIDPQLDANAVKALAQWEFRPASKQGVPVELEAIVHIPFRLPDE